MTQRKPRIASLVPSLTELAFALGLGDFMVGRTGFCVRPDPAVRALPKVGGTKDVDLERLRALAPTHVLVNIDENRRDAVEALRTFVPEVVVTHPCAPEDNLALFEQFSAAFGDAVPGVRTRAAMLGEELRAELAASRGASWREEPVLYLIWNAPWMTVARDTYISRLLATVGWRTLPACEGGPSGAARYPVVNPGEPWLAEVRRVLLSSEPFRFGPAHAAEAAALCPLAKVQAIDGERVGWYGSRAAETLRYLRALAAAPTD